MGFLVPKAPKLPEPAPPANPAILAKTTSDILPTSTLPSLVSSSPAGLRRKSELNKSSLIGGG